MRGRAPILHFAMGAGRTAAANGKTRVKGFHNYKL